MRGGEGWPLGQREAVVLHGDRGVEGLRASSPSSTGHQDHPRPGRTIGCRRRGRHRAQRPAWIITVVRCSHHPPSRPASRSSHPADIVLAGPTAARGHGRAPPPPPHRRATWREMMKGKTEQKDPLSTAALAGAGPGSCGPGAQARDGRPRVRT